MDYSKLILIFVMSIGLYITFLLLGFFLRNKNLKAQDIKESEENLSQKN